MEIRVKRTRKGWKAEYCFMVETPRDDTFRKFDRKLKRQVEKGLYETMRLKVEAMIVTAAQDIATKMGYKLVWEVVVPNDRN